MGGGRLEGKVHNQCSRRLVFSVASNSEWRRSTSEVDWTSPGRHGNRDHNTGMMTVEIMYL